MYGVSFPFLQINQEKTGELLKNKIYKSGYTVSDIQKYLKLSCPQPIYRWFRGITLPSLNNLYVLCQLLNVHMESLLVTRYYIDFCDCEEFDFEGQNRRLKYIEAQRKISSVS